MECSSGSGGMEVIPRLLAAGTFSHTIADDFAHQKSAAKYICRELLEADEANLLNEEDMHVYGESPMTDALQLVCCNTCKKPIKDSHFAAHAELCRSLQLTEQATLELDGSTGNRKPPRREKKKLAAYYANQASAVGEQRRSDSMGNIDSALSQSHLKSQTRAIPFSNEVKGHSTFVHAALMMDGTGTNPVNGDHPASVMHLPTKRHKLIANTHLPELESHGAEFGEIKTVIFTDGSTYFPAPLATKIYYSQRTNRLRARIRHLYFQDLNEQLCTDVVCPKRHAEMVTFQDSSLTDPSFDQMDNVHEAVTFCLKQCCQIAHGGIVVRFVQIRYDIVVALWVPNGCTWRPQFPSWLWWSRSPWQKSHFYKKERKKRSLGGLQPNSIPNPVLRVLNPSTKQNLFPCLICVTSSLHSQTKQYLAAAVGLFGTSNEILANVTKM